MIDPDIADGGRLTCEGCKSIDVRCWHREGRLRPGQHFSWSWTCDGEPSGNNVHTETDTVVLMYRSRNWGRRRMEVGTAARDDHLDYVFLRRPPSLV